MAAIAMEKPKSPCRLRLEARRCTNQKNNVEPSAAARKLAARIARAEQKRVVQQEYRMKKAREQVCRALLIAKQQNEIRQERSKSAEWNLINKQVRADKKRIQLQEEQRDRCKRRARIVSAKAEQASVLKTRRTEEASDRLQVKIEEACQRRELHYKAIRDRLGIHLQIVDQTKERVQMAKSIQRWYRKACHFRYAYIQLRALRKMLERVDQINNQIAQSSFDSAVKLMQDRNLIKLIDKVIRDIPLGAELSSRSSRLLSSRVFLTAALIASHPADALDSPNEYCSRKMYRAARRFIDSFALMVHHMDEYHALRCSYYRYDACRVLYVDCFNEWKKIDSQKMADELVERYAQIYAANCRSKVVSNPQNEVIFETRKFLAQLQQSLRMLIGENETFKRLQFVEASVNEQLANEQSKEGTFMKKSSSDKKKKVRNSHKPDFAFVRAIFSNESLAHELILDSNYKIERPEELKANSLEKAIEANMKAVFWNNVIEALTAEVPNYSPLVSLLGEIREGLAQIVSHRDVAAAEMLSQLNATELEKLEHSFQWESLRKLLASILSVILKSEAPARNGITTQWITSLACLQNSRQTKEAYAQMLPDVFAFIFDKIEEIRIDSLNAHLRLIAPYLQRHGVEHERKKFQEKLDQNKIAITATRTWMHHEVKQYCEVVEEHEIEALKLGSANAYDRVIRHCYLALSLVYIEGKSNFPETFYMDVDRIRNQRNQIDAIALMASFYALLKQTLSQYGASLSSTESQLMYKKLELLLKDSSVKIDDLIVEVLTAAKVASSDAGKCISVDDMKVLEGQLKDATSPDNAVFRVFSSRVRNLLNCYLSKNASSWEEDANRLGLSMFADELKRVCKCARVLYEHNVAVHAALYNQLITEVVNCM